MTTPMKQARQAVAELLQDALEPVELFTVSCRADAAARDAGRKRDLFGSLFDYAQVLPQGWRVEWLNSSGSMWDDALAYAVTDGRYGSLKPAALVPGAFDVATDARVNPALSQSA